MPKNDDGEEEIGSPAKPHYHTRELRDEEWSSAEARLENKEKQCAADKRSMSCSGVAFVVLLTSIPFHTVFQPSSS